MGGAHQVLDAFTGGGPGAQDSTQAPLDHAEGGHHEQAGGGHDDAQRAGAGLMSAEEVPDGLDAQVGARRKKDTATAFCARPSAVSDRGRESVNRQITMTEARPSMTDPSAHPSSERDPDRRPATRPRTPSPLIQTSDSHDSNRARCAARRHPGERASGAVVAQRSSPQPSAVSAVPAALASSVAPGAGARSGPSVDARLVLDVAGRFQLEGGVLDVEVPDQAVLDLIE